MRRSLSRQSFSKVKGIISCHPNTRHLNYYFCLNSTCLFCLPGLLLTSASKTPSAASSSDFLSFSDSSLRPGVGTTFSSPPSFSSCLLKQSSESGTSEGTTTLFGSLMSATTASAGTSHKYMITKRFFFFKIMFLPPTSFWMVCETWKISWVSFFLLSFSFLPVWNLDLEHSGFN